MTRKKSSQDFKSGRKKINHRWRDRKPVKTQLAEQDPSLDLAIWRDSDDRDNLRYRIPADESVHLGGVIFMEAFTPSVVSHLYAAIENLPGLDPDKMRKHLARIRESRSSARSGGWESIGVVRRPGEPIFTEGFNDPNLPEGVAAVWLKLHYVLPSLVVLVATFTVEEPVGDLSDILRTDYRTESRNRRIAMSGHFSRIRSRIPWARPRSFSVLHSLHMPQFQKRDACEGRIFGLEDLCWRWLSRNFPGRFSRENQGNRPSVRIFLTEKSDPFDRDAHALSLLGLGSSSLEVWKSSDIPGWGLSLSSGIINDDRRRFRAIVAARRSDAVLRGSAGGEEESAWVLTQQFHNYQSDLMIRWAMSCLLSVYADTLSELRDSAATKPLIPRPVRRARILDEYLLGDGLDASTVASEIRNLTEDVHRFRRGVVEYFESRDNLLSRPKPSGEETPRLGKINFFNELMGGVFKKKERESPDAESGSPQANRRELLPFLCKALSEQAVGLVTDMSAATNNIGASAQLRQAIANTRMQRAVVTLAIIATAAAVFGVWISVRKP
ncbi:hypothetical protein [Streptomyces sp. NPDC048845]|uniref:hypothetical protein n=1 Tax=Streptomyces sp. NPDC048845 TaxID=3155390 RepID=UPI003411FC15